jgi:hypothetical protein
MAWSPTSSAAEAEAASAYTDRMHGASPLEDWRGVDVGQIRAQLRLPVKERVRVMVEAANVLLGVQERAANDRSEAGVIPGRYGPSP